MASVTPRFAYVTYWGQPAVLDTEENTFSTFMSGMAAEYVVDRLNGGADPEGWPWFAMITS